ncbi:MAG: tyrosine-type recombinase/integrase [Candidatus Gottesmanbacteria bacterium]|nr:tyrosine-type recombinase/integrase [Candidatus Gottesmanbacteria bacterium]
MNLDQLVKDFLEYLEIERNVSQLTIRNYAHYLRRFLGFLATQIPSPARNATHSVAGGPAVKTVKDLTNKDITNETIREYRLYLSRFVDEHGISLKRVTQNYHLIALRSFLKYCLKRDVAVVAPEKIDLPKAESRSIKFLEREQVERLLQMPEISKADGLRDKAILETLFSTGLRVSELTNLNRDQINFDRREFGVIGKGRRPRVVFLSESAVEWLQRYLANRTDESIALFIRYAGKKPDADDKNGESFRLTPRSVQRLVEKYVKKARLPIKITPHGLRHSFATDLLTGGADLRAIQEMLGHKNVSTTQIYTHITNPQLKEIHNKYHRK